MSKVVRAEIIGEGIRKEGNLHPGRAQIDQVLLRPDGAEMCLNFRDPHVILGSDWLVSFRVKEGKISIMVKEVEVFERVDPSV